MPCLETRGRQRSEEAFQVHCSRELHEDTIHGCEVSSGENTEKKKKVKKKRRKTPKLKMLFGSMLVCVIVYRKGKRWQTQGSSEQWDGKHLQWADM